VEGGQFPAKRAIGEKITVTADIFSDGHDVVKAELLITPPSSRKTVIVPMKLLINDHWEASYIPDALGFYEYTLQGWVDHFATWQRGLRKKFEANQRLNVELLIGTEIMEKTAKTTKGTQAKKIKGWAQQLRESKDDATGVSLALSQEVTEVRDLRRWVLDRKTWMFVGHDTSARRAADALTLLTTCRKMGVEPRRYLRETLAKILAGESDPLALAPETFARKVAAEKAAAAVPVVAAA
jgi:hypothetical protein